MQFSWLLALTCCGIFLFSGQAIGQDEEKKPITALELSRLMTGWEKEVRGRANKDDKLKVLVKKHPLAILHCDRMNVPDIARQSGFSFVHGSAVEAVHRCATEIIFTGEPGPYLKIVPSKCFLVRLSKTDFEKDIDPGKITIDDPEIMTDGVIPLEGDVFLLRVRDSANDFFVAFQVVAIDPDWKYVSFVWRVLPGGRPIVRKFPFSSKT